MGAAWGPREDERNICCCLRFAAAGVKRAAPFLLTCCCLCSCHCLCVLHTNSKRRARAQVAKTSPRSWPARSPPSAAPPRVETTPSAQQPSSGQQQQLESPAGSTGQSPAQWHCGECCREEQGVCATHAGSRKGARARKRPAAAAAYACLCVLPLCATNNRCMLWCT